MIACHVREQTVARPRNDSVGCRVFALDHAGVEWRRVVLMCTIANTILSGVLSLVMVPLGKHVF